MLSVIALQTRQTAQSVQIAARITITYTTGNGGKSFVFTVTTHSLLIGMRLECFFGGTGEKGEG